MHSFQFLLLLVIGSFYVAETTHSDYTIELCRTERRHENCVETMPISNVLNYPFTKHGQRLYFKIADPNRRKHRQKSSLLWPYNCYLLTAGETPSPLNNIVKNGCPSRGQMSISFDRTTPIKVGFILSNLVADRTVQESLFIRCDVIECRNKGPNPNCPDESRCLDNGKDMWNIWTGETKTGVSEGYLFLQDELKDIVKAPTPFNDPSRTAHCAKKVAELKQQCSLYLTDLLFFPNA